MRGLLLWLREPFAKDQATFARLIEDCQFCVIVKPKDKIVVIPLPIVLKFRNRSILQS